MSLPTQEIVSMLEKMKEQMNDIRNRIEIIESNNRRITEDIPKTLEKMKTLDKQIDEMKEIVTYNDEDRVQKRNLQHETRKQIFAKFFEELSSRSSANPITFTYINPENVDRHIVCIDHAINMAREKYGISNSFYQTNDYYIEKLLEYILKNKVLHNVMNTEKYSFRRVISPQYSLDYNALVGEWSVLQTGLH